MLILIYDITFRSIYLKDALPNNSKDNWWWRRLFVFIHWGEQRCQFREDLGVGGRVAGEGCQGLAFRWQKSKLWQSIRTVSRVHFQAWWVFHLTVPLGERSRNTSWSHQIQDQPGWTIFCKDDELGLKNRISHWCRLWILFGSWRKIWFRYWLHGIHVSQCSSINSSHQCQLSHSPPTDTTGEAGRHQIRHLQKRLLCRTTANNRNLKENDKKIFMVDE